MCTRIEIIIRMIFLFKKKKKKKKNNRQPTYAIPAFSQHKTILHKIIISASFQSGLELEALFSLYSVDCAQRQRMSILR